MPAPARAVDRHGLAGLQGPLGGRLVGEKPLVSERRQDFRAWIEKAGSSRIRMGQVDQLRPGPALLVQQPAQPVSRQLPGEARGEHGQRPYDLPLGRGASPCALSGAVRAQGPANLLAGLPHDRPSMVEAKRAERDLEQLANAPARACGLVLVLVRYEVEPGVFLHQEVSDEEDSSSAFQQESVVRLRWSGSMHGQKVAGQPLLPAVQDVRWLLEIVSSCGSVHFGPELPPVAPGRSLMTASREADRADCPQPPQELLA